MKFEFHPEALAEYQEAARYYAGCQKGLELRFMAAVEHAIRQIIVALMHSHRKPGYWQKRIPNPAS